MVRNLELRRLASYAALALAAAACSQQATSVAVRSLEQSGRVSFVCLGEGPAPVATCTSSEDAYTHSLYALVTQTVRGEVAVINLSQGEVVDLDKSMPGYNFIPTGARPVDIVSTPGSTATFVASGEANKYAIYVLPSDRLLDPSPRLTSFSACALPTAPGRMAVVTQASSAAAPSTCDGVPHAGVPHDHGDLSLETLPPGSRKLVVTLPEHGEVAIIDAQELLDQPSGSFQACKIERLIKLHVDLPAVQPQQHWPPEIAADRSVCELTKPVEVSRSETYEPHPVHLEIDKETGLAYIADDAAPVVHVVDLSDPCNPIERAPLLPMSVVDPERAVFTREVAVSPTTSDGRKYAYAIDYREGSMMVFDVSLGATDRTPLLHPNPDRNPFQPPDRISFAVPVKSVAFMLRDDPIVDPTTGAAPYGVKCDPDINSTSPGTAYRSSSDYSEGAGPHKLRGIFGAAVLANGQIVILDVDDFDAPCRHSKDKGICDGEEYANYEGATGELSCHVVERHQARNAGFLTTGDVSGSRLPGLQTYPTLTQTGTTLPIGPANPLILAPRAKEGLPEIVQVGGKPVDTIEKNPLKAVHGMVWFDPREPRAHYDQDWTVTFEGSIPSFGGHVARLRPASEGQSGTVEDASAGFCWSGVHDFDAAVLVENSRGLPGSAQEPGSQAYQEALLHMDAVQITDGLLDKKDPYWSAPLGECSFQLCQETFGPRDVPKPARDLPILRAWQDRVEVSDSLGLARCCFPQMVTYTVRPRNQWVVLGTVSGFLHKVDVDPVTGRCIDSCDPTLKYRNARAFEGPYIDPASTDAEQNIPVIDSTQVFRNPMMQFWIAPAEPRKDESDEVRRLRMRDTTFAFTANAGFYPLLINLASSTTYVQPQSVTWLPQIGQLAVADGSVQGLMMVDIATLTLSKSYY